VNGIIRNPRIPADFPDADAFIGLAQDDATCTALNLDLFMVTPRSVAQASRREKL